MRTQSERLIEQARADFHRGEIDEASVVAQVIRAGRVDSERAALLEQVSRLLGQS